MRRLAYEKCHGVVLGTQLARSAWFASARGLTLSGNATNAKIPHADLNDRTTNGRLIWELTQE